MTLPAPVVTEESTHTIEDIIRKRIIDQVYYVYTAISVETSSN